MNRQVVETANSPGTAAFVVACDEQASNRQQILCRYIVEGDPELRIVVSPRGRTQQPRMERGHQPCDAPTSSEGPTGGKLKLDLNNRAGSNAFCGGRPQSAEADIGATTERCDRFAIERREVEPRVKPEALCAAVRDSVLSSR
jgi:hypothetical protein